MYQFLVYCLQVLLLQAQGTVNPLLTPPPPPPPGRGCLFDRGAYYFRKDDGISSPWRTRIRSKKAQVQQGWKSCSWGSESNPNFQLVKYKPSQISPRKVLQSWLLIKSIIYSWKIIKRGCLLGDLQYSCQKITCNICRGQYCLTLLDPIYVYKTWPTRSVTLPAGLTFYSQIHRDVINYVFAYWHMS